MEVRHFSARVAMSGDLFSLVKSCWIIVIESGMGTLVKRDVTSKLTSRSSGSTVSPEMSCIK